jgi:hypothetical protein
MKDIKEKKEGGKNMTYLANAFSLNMLPDTKETKIFVKEIETEYVKKILLNSGFVSAIGHSATAQVLTQILGFEISVNRIPIKLTKKDILVIFQLLTRLEEGKVLSKEELEKLAYKFYLVYIIDED